MTASKMTHNGYDSVTRYDIQCRVASRNPYKHWRNTYFRLNGYDIPQGVWCDATPSLGVSCHVTPTLACQKSSNPIYIGIVKWGKVTAQGEHEPIIDPGVWSAVHKAIHRRSMLPDRQLIVSAIKDFKRAEVDERDKEKERVSKEATRLQTVLDSTYDHYLAGEIDREMWQRAHQHHSEKLAQVRIRIQRLDSGDTIIYDRASDKESRHGWLETCRLAWCRPVCISKDSTCDYNRGAEGEQHG
jgi:hypothetical protein